ncbi:MAG TPA: hypothetical protein VFW27_14455 [Actinoplanes sp.]|nr:hypothetical protein [Actinoplanes sp.]
MSRADEVRAAFERELAVAEAEDELVRLKSEGTADEVRAHKQTLRELRHAHRVERAGGAVARPDAVAAVASVEETGAGQ